MGKQLFFVAALLAIFGLQLGDCMVAMAADQAAAQCCRTMPCTPANHNQPCCAQMVSAHASSLLPGHHGSLRAPAVAIVKYPAIPEIVGHAPDRSFGVQTQQHSPPDLYTLHASLLI